MLSHSQVKYQTVSRIASDHILGVRLGKLATCAETGAGEQKWYQTKLNVSKRLFCRGVLS